MKYLICIIFIIVLCKIRKVLNEKLIDKEMKPYIEAERKNKEECNYDLS